MGDLFGRDLWTQADEDFLGRKCYLLQSTVGRGF